MTTIEQNRGTWLSPCTRRCLLPCKAQRAKRAEKNRADAAEHRGVVARIFAWATSIAFFGKVSGALTQKGSLSDFSCVKNSQ